MFLALFFYSWFAGYSAGSVSRCGGLVDALLVVAVISLVWHLVRGRAAV